LPHIRHSNQSNAKEPASPARDPDDKLTSDKNKQKIKRTPPKTLN
jgi:hypothetical protein